MRFILLSCTLLAFAASSNSQNISVEKSRLISDIDKKLKEAIGNIRFFSTGGTRNTISNAKFYSSELGVKLEVDIKPDNTTATTWTYEFRPQDIFLVEEVTLPKESPVGQLKITLNKKAANISSYHKSDGYAYKFNEYVYINYLKVDPETIKTLREKLFKLRDVYTSEPNDNLKPLLEKMPRIKDFWISSDGASKTYNLKDVIAGNCNIYFYYYLQSVTTKGDEKGYYLSIVPLDAIADISFDANKSRPGCILLESGKQKFETYKLDGGDYKLTTAVKELPLFTDASLGVYRESIIETLNTKIKGCDGKKVKL